MLNPLRPANQSFRRTLAALVLGSALLGACSPALDWRQARPKNTDILANFPCKPHTLTQPVNLGQGPVDMSMTGCTAAGMTFALAHVNVGRPDAVPGALAVLRRSAVGNIHASVLRSSPSAIDHATPGLTDAVELDLSGKDPDGASLREHVVLFAQGTHVFQALVLQPEGHANADAVRTFTGSIQLPASAS